MMLNNKQWTEKKKELVRKARSDAADRAYNNYLNMRGRYGEDHPRVQRLKKKWVEVEWKHISNLPG